MRLQRTLQGLALVVCIAVISAGAGVYVLLDHLNNRLTEQRIGLQAARYTADIRTQLVHYRTRLQSQARQAPADLIKNPAEAEQVLQSLCPAQLRCQAYLFDRQGHLMASSLALQAAGRVPETYRSFFSEALAGGQGLLATADPVTQTSRIYMSEQVQGGQGVPSGVLVMSLSGRALGQSLDDLATPAALISPAGQILYANQSGWIGRQLSNMASADARLGLVQDDASHAHIGALHYRLSRISLKGAPGWQLMLLEPVTGPAALIVSMPFWALVAGVGLFLLTAFTLLWSRARYETQRVQQQLLAEQAAADQRQALMNACETPVISVRHGKILEANQAALALLGLSQDQLYTVRQHDFFALPADSQPGQAVEVTGRCSAGKELALEVSREPQGAFELFKIRDLALQKATERHARYKAHYDGLTGLANRNLLQERLQTELELARTEEQSLHLLFIDLDDFKKVNDSRGHVVGDQLLVMAAQRLQQVCSAHTLLARYGGDEFVLILRPGTGLDQVKSLAAAVNQALTQVFQIQHSRYFISASIGLASYPADAADTTELLQKADTAMYSAKSEGGNTCCQYSPAMNRDINERLAIEQQLRGALDNHEFHLVYQPLFCAREQRLMGAEALLRWNNAELGSVSPDTFIPLAEQTGLIESIGHWVLSQAVQQVETWQRQGLGALNISINVSPRQFRDQAIIKSVESVLANTPVPASSITLEVTEGLLMRRATDTAASLHSLKRLGVRLSMDDFGTGYSSLSYLKRYPFDSLKIDREFVRDINTDKSDRQLITAALSMARALGMRVVAEGIENHEQLKFLDQAGCDLVQGFLLGKPVAPEQFVRMYFDRELVKQCL